MNLFQSLSENNHTLSLRVSSAVLIPPSLEAFSATAEATAGVAMSLVVKFHKGQLPSRQPAGAPLPKLGTTEHILERLKSQINNKSSTGKP